MKKRVKQIFSLLLVGSILMCILSGCGGASGSQAMSSASVTSVTQDDTNSVAPTTELVIGTSTAWETLTPVRNMGSYRWLT